MGTIEEKLRELDKVTRVEPDATFKEAGINFTRDKFKEAIAMYEEVLTKYPEHALAHPSGYKVGECLVRTGDHVGAEKAWSAYVEKGMLLPWRAQAMIGLGDIALECRLQLDAARAIYMKADELSKNEDLDESWKDARADIAVRLGMCSYIVGDIKEAEQFFTMADSLRPDIRWGEDIPAGIGLLVEACRKKTSLVPDNVMKGGDTQTRLILSLASLYAGGWQYEKARELYSRMTKCKFDATRIQKAYARMEEGEMCRMSDRKEEAILCYKDFEPGGPHANTPFTGEGILRGAVIQFTVDETRGEALRKFELVAAKYPLDKEASRARLYIGMHWYWNGEYKKAIVAWRKLISLYPRSMWSEQANRELIPLALEKYNNKKKEAAK